MLVQKLRANGQDKKTSTWNSTAFYIGLRINEHKLGKVLPNASPGFPSECEPK